MGGRGGQKGGGTKRYGQWNIQPLVTQNSPLITDHLRDIDMELEILNRRRQMIQQEHQLLDRERKYNLKRQYEYEQPTTSNNQPYYHSQQGNKRQATENIPKLFKPLPRVEPWENKTQFNPIFDFKPPPLLGVAPRSRPIDSSRPIATTSKNFRSSKPEAPVRKDFKLTKVTKQRSRTSLLKKKPMLSNQPNSSNPPKLNEPKTAPLLKEDDSVILRPDVQPSPQIKGRMELALGSIIKDIKQLDPILNNPSTTIHCKKMIKQIIRERIRSVMMGKKVGHMQYIVAQYREKYPIETDAEVLKLGQYFQAYNIHTLGITPIINSENIKKFFKVNLRNVLNKKVEKLLSCNDTSGDCENDENVIKMMKDVIELKDSEISEDSTHAPESSNNDFTNNEETEEVLGQAIKKAKIYFKLMENLIHANLPSLLLSHQQNFVDLINTDKEFQLAKTEILEATVKETVKLLANKIDNIDKKENANDEEINISESTPLKEKELAAQATPPKIDVTLVKTPTSTIMECPYYVKVIGRPQLPPRAAVYAYLEQFKPVSIKKHKTIGNLLVIGFNEKEGYDKIIEADDKTIGENTITIKANETVKQTPIIGVTENTLNVVSQKEISCDSTINASPQNNKVDESDKDIDKVQDLLYIEKELEDQITNILTVINTGDSDDNADINKSGSVEEITKIASANQNQNETTSYEETKHEDNKFKPMETISVASENVNSCRSNYAKEEENEIENLSPSVTDTKIKGERNETENISPSETNTEINENKINLEENSKTENLELADFGREDLKNTAVRATPTRSSSRLPTTSSIKTRRASRLAQLNEQN